MPLTLVQQASGTTGAATSFTTVTPAFSSASITGNMVLLFVASNATVSTPSGWTLDSSVVGSQGLYCYRRASAGETTFTAVTITASTCWWLTEYSGQAASPLDVHVTTSTSSTVTSFATASSGTLAQADELALAIFSSSLNSTSGAPGVFSGETGGFTEVAADIGTSKPSGSGTNVGLVVCSQAVLATTALASTATLNRGSATATLLVTYKAAASTAAPAGLAAGTGTAPDAAVSTVPTVNAPAGLAAAAGTVPAGVITDETGDGITDETGNPFLDEGGTTAAIGVTAGASAAGTAQPATAGTTAFANAPAGLATGTGTAQPATVTTATSGNAPAGLAAAAGTVPQPATAITVPAATATGTGTAGAAGHGTTAGVAAATAAAQPATLAATAAAQAAHALGAALAATGAAVEPFTVGTLTAADQRTGGPGG